MPFVRVSRDKRGYEHIYLFEVSNRRPSKPRILYWFRTPPGVRVGREPFDEPVKRALEALNPGVRFDWKKLASDTLPAPDVENWRERRRVEREAKRARRGDEERNAAGRDEPEADEEQAGEAIASEESAGEMPGDDLPDEAVAAAGGLSAPSQKPVAISGASASEAGPAGRHRRRRRGGRNRRSSHAPGLPVALPAGGPARSSSSLSDRSGSDRAGPEPAGPDRSVSDTAVSNTSVSDTSVSDTAWSYTAGSDTAVSNTVKAGADRSEEAGAGPLPSEEEK